MCKRMLCFPPQKALGGRRAKPWLPTVEGSGPFDRGQRAGGARSTLQWPFSFLRRPSHPARQYAMSNVVWGGDAYPGGREGAAGDEELVLGGEDDEPGGKSRPGPRFVASTASGRQLQILVRTATVAAKQQQQIVTQQQAGLSAGPRQYSPVKGEAGHELQSRPLEDCAVDARAVVCMAGPAALPTPGVCAAPHKLASGFGSVPLDAAPSRGPSWNPAGGAHQSAPSAGTNAGAALPQSTSVAGEREGGRAHGPGASEGSSHGPLDSDASCSSSVVDGRFLLASSASEASRCGSGVLTSTAGSVVISDRMSADGGGLAGLSPAGSTAGGWPAGVALGGGLGAAKPGLDPAAAWYSRALHKQLNGASAEMQGKVHVA